MGSTITIRTDKELRAALAKRAAERGETVSELVRRILEQALSGGPLGARIGHLKGKLNLPRPAAGSWRDEIRRRNWRR